MCAIDACITHTHTHKHTSRDKGVPFWRPNLKTEGKVHSLIRQPSA